MLNKKIVILFFLSLLFLTPVVQAEDFESPEAFTDYIYSNYAAKSFRTVYNNFAAELKRIFGLKTYVDFQKTNFNKYNLKYTKIDVGKAEKVDFKEIKKNFNYARDFGDYYKLKVKYLLNFDHFGSREKESEKIVYLRKINSDFQIFWDHKAALENKKAINDDQNE